MILGTRRRIAAAVATVAAAISLALVMSGRGCADADATPEGTVRAFVAAAHAGDKRAAWELLGPMTRKRFEEAAIATTEKVGGPRRFAPQDMLETDESDADATREAIDVKVVEKNGDEAVVEIAGPQGKKDRLKVVRVGRQWKVEL